jgi:hypothetical protein
MEEAAPATVHGTLARVRRNKRIVLTSFLILGLAVSFWSRSRYPTLNEKAIMGGETQAEDPLTFDAFIQAQRGDPLYEKIAISSINWGVENRKGMRRPGKFPPHPPE